MKNKHNWLALAVGNSRLHWAWFEQLTLIETWNTPHIINRVRPSQLPQIFFGNRKKQTNLPVYLASVVHKQTKLWQDYNKLHLISLKDLKLTNTYPTMGVDRALAVSGAIATYNQSCLVIDGGTALTFTGAEQNGKLIGGAILPGLRSQLITLKQKTAALPEVQLPDTLPPRWALDTDQAIASGIIYTAIAVIYSYIMDWLEHFPNSKIIITGGDAERLSRYLHQQYPNLAAHILVDQNLVFQGIKLVYAQRKTSNQRIGDHHNAN